VSAFTLNDRTVHPSLNRIEGPAGAVTVEPRVMEVLVLLAGRGGAVVSKDELVQEVWEGRFVTDDVIWRSIAELRRALGDEAKGSAFIATVPKRGYRLLVEARPVPPSTAEAPQIVPLESAQEPKPLPGRPPRRFARLGWAFGVAAVLGLAGLLLALRSGPAPAPAATVIPEAAREAYLRGQFFLERGTPDDIVESRDAFTEAVAAAPDSAPIQAGLAEAFYLLVIFNRVPPDVGFPRAEAAARRAIALDPDDGETRATLGSILLRHDLDWRGAEAELLRARELAPKSARVHHDLAWLLVDLGRFDEGVRAMEEARRLDPLSLRANSDVGWVLYRARRYREAADEMRRILTLEPRFSMARHCLERALIHLGDLEGALAVTREGLLAGQEKEGEVEALTAGEPAEALRRVAALRLERALARKGGVSPYHQAALHAELGQTEEAFAALDRAFDRRDPARADLGVDPAFDPLRPDPRFAAYVTRLGRPR
jgi:DNA-binding winged helix-turn-helix (wHTH) protein/Flp pilus assembly protein TadD